MMSYLIFPSFITNASLRICNHLPHKRGDFSSAAAATASTQIDVEYLRRECGVTFTGIGDTSVLRMELDNGSAANLMLPSGLITSFKTQMWHGATMELLHTFVDSVVAAAPVVLGGLSLSFACEDDATGIPWSPDSWALHQVSVSPRESIQVELISKSELGNARVKHIITLEPDVLDSEIVVSNSSTTSSLHLKGSAMCHLAVSTPNAAYTVGLQGSDYFIRPPFVSTFSIIPKNFNRTDRQPGKFNNLFSKWGARKQNAEDDVESLARDVEEELAGQKEDSYKHLTEKLSRIYTSTPRSLTIMDRGRRNSMTMRREGFKEVYLLSPGSEHEWYGKYSYICVGHASLLEPIILNAQSEWKGRLQLRNPNSKIL